MLGRSGHLCLMVVGLFFLFSMLSRKSVDDIQVPEAVHKAVKQWAGHKRPARILPESSPNNCTDTWLDNLVSEATNLTSTITYTRRCVKAKRKNRQPRQTMTRKDEPLFKGTRMIDLGQCRRIPEPECVPLELEVHPAPALEDASHMIFGASTSIDRLFDSIPQFARWLGFNGAKIVVLVSKSTAASRKEAEDEMRELGMNATVLPVDERLVPAQRHLSITEEIYRLRDPGKTEWHVVIDDDTFFPYMQATIDHLRRHYNHQKPWYVGALSEDENAVKTFGVQAFGGGGIFLSSALAEQIHAAFDQCIRRNPGHGDVIIRDCIFKYTKTKLTVDGNFHQLDLEGDVAGFYETGQMPLTLHHYKSWTHLALERMHLVSDYCGDCFLQRWQFSDDVILTNGFSAVYYPQGIHFDVDRMESTQSTRRRNYAWSLNLRPGLSPEEKISYRLLDTRVEPDGSLRQLYYKPGKLNAEGEKRTNDDVLEILWGDDVF